MFAAIPVKSIKLFYQIIKCISKSGEEIYLEFYPDKVGIKLK